MRRKDRELKRFDELVRVMRECDVCRLALNDEDGYPYLLPLNFGMQVEGEQVTLYFHGAMEGRKYELMERDPRVGFEMDCEHAFVLDDEDHSCTMAYASVIGKGRLEWVPEEQKLDALRCLMGHYHAEAFPFDTAVMPRTKVFRLVVEQMSGKRRRNPMRK